MPATPTEGAHYYVAADANRDVMRCIAVLDDGRAVVSNGDSVQVVDPADIKRVPTTVGDVLAVIGRLRVELVSGEVGDADDLLSALEAWVRGIPVPDAERE